MGSMRKHRKRESNDDSIFFMYQPDGRIKGEFGSPPYGQDPDFGNNSVDMIAEKNSFQEEAGFYLRSDRYNFIDPFNI